MTVSNVLQLRPTFSVRNDAFSCSGGGLRCFQPLLSHPGEVATSRYLQDTVVDAVCSGTVQGGGGGCPLIIGRVNEKNESIFFLSFSPCISSYDAQRETQPCRDN